MIIFALNVTMFEFWNSNDCDWNIFEFL